MDLRNQLDHKRSTSVYVNGTSYDIDSKGICKGLKKDDADKLLKNEAWTKSLVQKSAPPKSKAASRSVLLDAEDNPVVPPEPESKPEVDDGNPVDLEAEAGTSEPEGDGGAVEEVVPAEGENWPDPVDTMSIGYLRLMADAYEIKYKSNTKEKALCKAIMKAMYP